MGRLVRRYIRSYKSSIVQDIRGNIATTIEGLKIEQNTYGSITVTGIQSGIRIEQSSEATVVNSAQIYGLYITNYILHAPAGGYIMARLDDNGDQTLYSFMYFNKGQGDCTYLIHLRPVVTSAWNTTGSVSSNDGWIRIKVHNVDRYIALYSTKD